MRIVDIAIGLIMGGMLSVFHFGGLWLVLKRMPRSSRPLLLFWGTTMIRYGLTIGGMYVALTIGGTVLFSACAGLYLVRLLVVPRLADKMKGNQKSYVQEA